MTPGTITQLAIVIVFVLPGIVYQVVRARLSGASPENQDSTNKILRALAASIVLVSIYMIMVGPSIVKAFGYVGANHQRWVAVNPRLAGSYVGVFIFVVPAAAAFIIAARWSLAAQVAGAHERGLLSPSGWLAQTRGGHLLNGQLASLGSKASGKAGLRYDPTPTAWDWATDHAAAFQGFVRVKTKDGQWQGGVFGQGSYFSTFPEAPAIFVEQAWQLDDSGTFQAEQDLSRGTWIPCHEAITVEFTSLGPGSRAREGIQSVEEV